MTPSRRSIPCTSILSCGFFALPFAGALFVAFVGATGLTVEAATTEPTQNEFQLQERNDSGVTGLVRLSTSDVDTRVEVEVSGPDSEYLPYIHRGTCDDFAVDVAIPLALARPEESTTTTVDLSLDELTNGLYVIDLHVARGSLESLMDPETSVACGVLVSADSADQELQPPIAGIGPFKDGGSYLIVAALSFLGVGFGIAGVLTRRVKPLVRIEDVNPVALQRLRGLFV